MVHLQSMQVLRWLIVCSVLLLDQITKWLVKGRIYAACEITSWCSVTPVMNRGASWGLGREWAYMPLILAGLACCFIVLLCRQAHRSGWRANIAYSLIIGGALSNAIDRVVWQGVIDFIDLHYLHYHWPTFNCADVAIVIGVLYILSQPQ